MHCYVWETEIGKQIPKGYAVHHKDHNKKNNEINNLQLVTAEEHAKIHSVELTDEQKLKRQNNIIQNAMPKSIEWHKSLNGSEWHKEHYKQMKDKLHKKAEFQCACCGKSFVAVVTGKNKFCSNNCKSKYRRINGLDNEIRECEYCGRKFATNKYSKAKFCSKQCAAIHKSKERTT